MNAKFSVLDIYVEPIIYLLIYNLQDFIFKNRPLYNSLDKMSRHSDFKIFKVVFVIT